MGRRSRAELVHERTVPGNERLSEQHENWATPSAATTAATIAGRRRSSARRIAIAIQTTERADPREPDREPVEPTGAMADDPGFGTAVE